MKIIDYFEKIKKAYFSTFDLVTPFKIDNKEYLGYGFFQNNAQKFVLVKNAKLWEVNSFEHIIFIEDNNSTEDAVEEGINLIKDYMEYNFVRKGKKYPETNHMYSFLTIIILTNNHISKELQYKITNFKFKRNYLLTIRGYSEGRLAIINPENNIFISNKASKSLKDFYISLF
ncbi:hypothetical protein [Fusobacterium sp. PH5-44]|uniref:hypothetical protein n=1 Tax=unclassified Fusobacterium TaxID=2648384 RepID=UPI003D1D9681